MKFLTEWLLGGRDSPLIQQTAVQALHMLTGLMLAWYHGLHKLRDGLSWKAGKAPTWPFLEEVRAAGFPMPVPNAWMATAVQLGGGVCLVLGLFTRPAALALTGALGGAVYTTLVLKKESQLALVYLLLLLAVIGLGPGPWSLDALLFR